MYDRFALVYDELMDDVPYEEWAELLHKLIQKYGISRPVAKEAPSGPLEEERNLVLELGCGTGTVTELLSKKGYDMIGIDSSESMLAKAEEKRERSGSKILYLLQEMQSFELYGMVGTIYCICDSINYLLTDEDLLSTFALVRNYLVPGGIFIFDFNTDYKYREVIGERTIAENREDVSFIWDNIYDDESRINEYDLTIFIREEPGEEMFKRFLESHFQKGYKLDEIRGLLFKAGLKVISVFDADSGKEPKESSERIFIVAAKEE